MKNKKLIMGLAVCLLCFGCQNDIISDFESNNEQNSFNSIDDISSQISNDISSDNSNSSNYQDSNNSYDNTGDNDSSDSNIADVVNKKSIKEIKEIAKQYETNKDVYGIYETNIKISIDLKLLACLDAITTKGSYGNRYKILMSDGIDYIYVKTNQTNYTYLKDYVQEQGVYTILGNISLYNDEVEISNTTKPIYLKDKKVEMAYETLTNEYTLEQIYTDLNSMTLNCKGVAFSKIVRTKVKCLAKDINNTNLYFTDGKKIINVHGDNKVTNKFQKDSSYILYGALSMYNFRGGLEYVFHESLNENIEFDTSNLTIKTASELYNYKYEVDKNSSYLEYSSLFESPFIVNGYVNYYEKDNKQYLVLEDNYNENIYSTYQNAISSKSLFFVNENYIKLTSSNVTYCPLYEYVFESQQVQTIVFYYGWNTLKYPQVYCYSFEII